MESNLVNHQLLLRLPDINNLDNQDLKFQILDYYDFSEMIEEYTTKTLMANRELINKLVDMEGFYYKHGYPILNPNKKGMKVTINNYLTKELKNNCISYQTDCIQTIRTNLPKG